MTLTQEDYDALSEPFAASAIRFRIDGRPRNGKVRILTYVDARLVARRLSQVDLNWSGEPSFPGYSKEDGIGLAQGLPVVYHLTVKGVTRTDVGQIGPALFGENKGDFVADDKHVKMAVSDALKRSAVLFGVGGYLYDLGNTYAEVAKHTDADGKYLTNAGKEYLRKQYLTKVFGEPGPSPDKTPEEPKKAVTKKKKAKEDAPLAKEDNEEDPYTAVIAGIFKLLDRSPEAGIVWLSGRKNKKLAVKKTVQQAIDKGVEEDALLELLDTNGLSELVPA